MIPQRACRHGKDAVIEEILDWRPYDYVTDLTIVATPLGSLKLKHTIEFEPTTAGTTIHMRFAGPMSKKGQALAAHVGSEYGAALESRVPTLIEQLDQAYARRNEDRGPEPRLVAPKIDGPLAGLPPLMMLD